MLVSTIIERAHVMCDELWANTNVVFSLLLPRHSNMHITDVGWLSKRIHMCLTMENMHTTVETIFEPTQIHKKSLRYGVGIFYFSLVRQGAKSKY